MDRNEDRENVELLKSGDISAFSTLFKKYSERLYAFALSIAKEPYIAEEITQQVFLKVWEKRPEINEYLSFKSFLFSITYSETISWLRKDTAEKRKMSRWGENSSFESEETTHTVEFNNIESLANGIIDELPEKRKEIFKLSREQGYSYKEIAQKLGLSVKTVENQVSAALRTIREKLGEDKIISILYYFLISQ
ncbi:RNA polymerase sigma factor [Mangrovibacterium diazotrophicum]|uniref:RNA polymerase sigma factor n=1 Tax=Mangrovibacterium diazotrophicum TaxID=1261403 RepID=A0A419W464_9BACT|nr:RNA polymerase sigma-70 factor [Mangrovibacterium diazotrophicum]RKD90236.1 RNA polymerase sigma-70 factor (ECF subfamily) [Mangrovibacterium diazotrophicum]